MCRVVNQREILDVGDQPGQESWTYPPFVLDYEVSRGEILLFLHTVFLMLSARWWNL